MLFMTNLRNIKQLIFDADDTLWENNVFFEMTTKNIFQIFMESGVPVQKIREEFRKVELNVVNDRGYGSDNYLYILNTLFNTHTGNGAANPDRNKFDIEINKFNQHRVNKPVLFSKVNETLNYLKKRYNLFLLTKGNYAEQKRKIDASGLRKYFIDSFILPEKDDLTYNKLILENNWQPQQTCMIGNSPKSDINPALRNGLQAVFIPYAYTWHLDNEKIIKNNQCVTTVEKFADLVNIL